MISAYDRFQDICKRGFQQETAQVIASNQHLVQLEHGKLTESHNDGI